MQLEENHINMENNINWTTSCDDGGEGPRSEDEAYLEHFVYSAVKPLAMRLEDEDIYLAAASALQHEEHLGESTAAASAHQHDEPLCQGSRLNRIGASAAE